jgi:hypothetical protein
VITALRSAFPVLAAVGTTLPETMIPIVAVLAAVFAVA